MKPGPWPPPNTETPREKPLTAPLECESTHKMSPHETCLYTLYNDVPYRVIYGKTPSRPPATAEATKEKPPLETKTCAEGRNGRPAPGLNHMNDYIGP